MKSKNKYSEQRFGHVNATNPNSYLNVVFIKFGSGHLCSTAVQYCCAIQDCEPMSKQQHVVQYILVN